MHIKSYTNADSLINKFIEFKARVVLHKKQETGNRKQDIFIHPKDNKSIQHKNHTIYYIYVDMIKISSKNIEYGLKEQEHTDWSDIIGTDTMNEK